jgi:hypothetical protein
MATLTYEELGIPAIKDFDYSNYDKVFIALFRIGAVIVVADTRAISLKDLGDQRLFVLFTISAGSRIKLLISQNSKNVLKTQSIL